MIKAIFFDFDGVIQDSYELHYKLSQKKIKDLTREEHRKLFEGNVHEEREKLKHRDSGYDMLTHFAAARQELDIKEDIKKTLISLAKKYILGIITSSNESGLNRYLDGRGLSKIFSFIYGVETHKSKIEKFKIALKELKLESSEVFFVSDTLGDILEAKKVGIKTIAVDFGYHERERLQKGNPYAIISDFRDIPKIVEKIN